jgi:hypothetical protein
MAISVICGGVRGIPDRSLVWALCNINRLVQETLTIHACPLARLNGGGRLLLASHRFPPYYMMLSHTARFRIFRRRKNTSSTSPSQTTRNELNCLVHTSEPVVRKARRFLHLRLGFAYSVESNGPLLVQAFNAEMQAFFKLHSRYLTDNDSRRDL